MALAKRRPEAKHAAKKRQAKRSPAKRKRAARKVVVAEPMPYRPVPDSILTGGDLDADRQRAWDSGDEAVGGSVALPDQDVVDEIGRALGVEQEPTAEVLTSGEILHERDRHRWEQEG
jgi:hypothetical protein